MRICLDFDGVLHDAQHPLKGRKMGPPIDGALQGVYQLKAEQHTLVIHTARAQTEAQAKHIYAWLLFYGFPRIAVSVPKPIAHVYVDDRGMRFTSWPLSLP